MCVVMSVGTRVASVTREESYALTLKFSYVEIPMLKH
jgi:hypothetical protein